MAQQHFGSRLAEARKKRGLSLEQVHAQLRITPTILESLEHSDFYRMPLKGHARNMVSAYARFLGLDSTELTKQFLKEYHDFENHVARADNLPAGFSGYRARATSSGGIEARTTSDMRSGGAESSQGFNSMWNKRIPRTALSDGYYGQTQGQAVVRPRVTAGGNVGAGVGSAGVGPGAGGTGARSGGVGAGALGSGGGLAGGVGGSMGANGANTTGDLSVTAGGGIAGGRAAGAGTAGGGIAGGRAAGAGTAAGGRQATGANNYGAGRSTASYGAPRPGSGYGKERVPSNHGSVRSGNTYRPPQTGAKGPAGLQAGLGQRQGSGLVGGRAAPVPGTPARSTVPGIAGRSSAAGIGYSNTRANDATFGGRKRIQGNENMRSQSSRVGRSNDDGEQLDSQYGMGSYPTKPSLPMRLFGSLFNNPIALVIVLILILVLLFAVWAIAANSCKAKEDNAVTPTLVGSVVTGDEGTTDGTSDGTQAPAATGFELIVRPDPGEGPYTEVTVDGVVVFANAALEEEQKWTVTRDCKVWTAQVATLNVLKDGVEQPWDWGNGAGWVTNQDTGFCEWTYSVDQAQTQAGS